MDQSSGQAASASGRPSAARFRGTPLFNGDYLGHCVQEFRQHHSNGPPLANLILPCHGETGSPQICVK